MNFFPFDDINALKVEAEDEITARDESGDLPKKKQDYIDEVTDLFVLAYVYGTNDISDQLGEKIDPDVEEMRSVIEERFDGKNYIDRLNEYLESGTAYDIGRVIETDAHRIYNAALYTGAKKAGATKKTWNCMMLPTSRDTHIYLDGVTVGIDDEFYSFKGGSTLYPGQWGIAEEDINCLCTLTFSK